VTLSIKEVTAEGEGEEVVQEAATEEGEEEMVESWWRRPRGF